MPENGGRPQMTDVGDGDDDNDIHEDSLTRKSQPASSSGVVCASVSNQVSHAVFVPSGVSPIPSLSPAAGGLSEQQRRGDDRQRSSEFVSRSVKRAHTVVVLHRPPSPSRAPASMAAYRMTLDLADNGAKPKVGAEAR